MNNHQKFTLKKRKIDVTEISVENQNYHTPKLSYWNSVNLISENRNLKMKNFSSFFFFNNNKWL